jgi:hypothetical protein
MGLPHRRPSPLPLLDAPASPPLLPASGGGTWPPMTLELAGGAAPSGPSATSETTHSGEPRLLAGGRLGLALSA